MNWDIFECKSSNTQPTDQISGANHLGKTPRGKFKKKEPVSDVSGTCKDNQTAKTPCF